MANKVKTIILIVLIMVISGCSKAPKTIESSKDSQNDNKVDASIAEASITNLRVVTNKTNRGLMLSGVGTGDGYYDSIPWTEEMYDEESPWIHVSNLIYIDYESQTRIYLCGVPGCAHNSENCTSYIRYPRGIDLFTNSSGTILFCMASGAAGGEIYSDDDLGRIYQMNLDGSNKKELLKLKANESFSISDPVIADEMHIYVCIDVMRDAIIGPEKELREINVNDGTVSKLINLKQEEIVTSAYDDNIVIADWSSYDKTMKATIRGYSISKKVVSVLYEGETGDYFIAEDNYAFYSKRKDDNSGIITVIDLKDGDIKQIENIPHEAVGIVFIYNYFDNRIHWNYIDKSEVGISHEYIVDIDTGEFIKRTLYYNDVNNIPQMVQIIAEIKDSFLVLMGTENSKISMVDGEGIPHIYDFPNKPTYALISKDDYWNNIPNYIGIENTF